MKTRIIGMVLALAVLVTGCSKTTEVTPQNQAKFRKTYINPEVKLANHLRYLKPDPSILIGGMLGAAVVDGNALRAGKKFEAQLVKDNQSIEKLVFTAFKTQMAKAPTVKFTSKERADVVVNLEVVSYGFVNPMGMAGKMRPVMEVEAKAIDQSTNTVIWEKTVSYKPLASSGTPVYAWTELEHNSKLVAESLQQLSNRAAIQLVDSCCSIAKG